MFLVLRSVSTSSVALLAEGVDRNNLLPYRCHAYRVALLAEGVDRNSGAGSTTVGVLGRPPRGGRDRNLLARLNAQRHPSRPPRGGRG